MALRERNSIFLEDRLNEMRNSLWLSFHYSNKLNESMIMESFGMVPDIDLYVDTFRECLLQQTNNGVTSTTFVITKNIFSNIPGCWFKDVEIKVQYTNNQTKPKVIKGNFESEVTLVQGKINVLKGAFIFNGDINYIVNRMPMIIGHEILHAYESWKRLLNKSKSIFDAAKDGHVLQNNQIKELSKNDIEKALAEIFYYCNNIERRAYLAQLNQELLSYKENIKDVDSAIQIIQKIPVYKNLIIVGENLQVIRDEIKVNSTCRTVVINYFKRLTGENRNAEYILRYLEKLWSKTWKHFRLRTTRLIRSLFDSNNVAPSWIEEFDKPVKRLKKNKED